MSKHGYPPVKGNWAPRTGEGSPLTYLGVDGWSYHNSNTGTIETPMAGDWRTREVTHPDIPTLTVICTERYNEGWMEIERIGGSVSSDAFMITDARKGFSYHPIASAVHATLINVSPDGGGCTIGNLITDSAVMTGTGFYCIKYDPVETQDLVQPLTDTLKQLSTFQTIGQYYVYTFDLLEPTTLVQIGVSVWIDASSDITDARLWIGSHLPDGALSAANVGMNEFVAGGGAVAVVGENHVDWEFPTPVQEGITHVAFIASNKPLIFQGTMINSVWIPKFLLHKRDVEKDPILAMHAWIDGTNYAIGDRVWEGWQPYPCKPRIYKCVTAGVQATSFAANAAKWQVMDESLYSPDTLKNLTLTNGVLKYNDGTTDRLEFTSGEMRLRSMDGWSYFRISDTQFSMIDGTSSGSYTRFDINGASSALISPTAKYSMAVADGSFLVVGNSINRNIVDDTQNVSLSPTGAAFMRITNALIDFKTDDFELADSTGLRLVSNSLNTFMASPSGAMSLTADDTGCYYGADEIAITNKLLTSTTFVVTQNMDVTIGVLSANIDSIIPDGITEFTIRDLDANIGTYTVRMIFAGSSNELILAIPHDFVRVSKHNGVWYYYNHRNGLGQRITT